ncbi:GTP-binding protein [Ezakiella coagulans]|uniref:GTPase Der n=1 Tax=Ezakiella coagulans TaxID=46507 RepID=A0A2U1E3P5_9FIRM|nr:ribosome biogenesis GTPase Der [Ezakiella coagulans]PVY94573.1 GTP-binding protein [Ezakiella coagulans]UQK60616.1 ribosome biogenesis GTPase Der [Ezakiella coagulans]
MRDKIVTLVGRPNVGKSTLFNRITNNRSSITEDTPGVTRDRLYARAEWLGKPFLLVDTGGLDPQSDDDFMPEIIEQAEVAIESSVAVIFIVDGVSGLTSTDKTILSMLRRMNSNIVLAINKFDSKESQDNFYDFYELGINEMVQISAEHGTGVGDLLDEVFKFFPQDEEIEENPDEIKVALIGKPNVGKSSLLNNILGEKRAIVTNIPGTTRDSIDTFVEIGGRDFRLIDTAGLRKKSKITEAVERFSAIRTLSAIDESDICVLVIDAVEGPTEQDTKVMGYAFENRKGVVIAINKWDLVEKDSFTQRDYVKEIRNKIQYVPFAPIVFISAKTGQRVDTLIDTVVKVYDNYNKRIPTGVLNKIVSDAILLNVTPQDKGRRLKIYYGSQVSAAPPVVIFYVNDTKLTHFSYTRYLENSIRKNYDFEGVPISIVYKNRGE